MVLQNWPNVWPKEFERGKWLEFVQILNKF